MQIFEPTVGVSEFAQMIRDAGGTMTNEKLLGIAQCGGFDGYHIYIYRIKSSIEGFVSQDDAKKWIAAHSVETYIPQEYIDYADGETA